MPFINRYVNNLNGALTFTGNTLGLNKQVNTNNPGTAGSIGTFITLNTALQDGGFPVGTTSNWRQNGSAAVLRIPSSALRIAYAELIWGGSYNLGGENVSAFLDNAVTFTTPAGTFSVSPDPITSQTLTSTAFYIRSANVTNLVSGGGTYSVGGVPGTQSNSENNTNACGWTLAVAYEDPLQKSRNLSIFVGAELTNSSVGSSTAVVSGFSTPVSGTVNGRLLLSALEGDAFIVGDQFQFGRDINSLSPVSGPNNPISNFFASQINGDTGALDTSGTFGTLNTPVGSTTYAGGRQGWDITNIDVSSFLTNGQTSATARGTTTGDQYVINAIALQIDINAPILSVTKTASPTSARTGDAITYTVRATNSGTANATVTIATDSLSSGTTLVPNSVTLDGIQRPGLDPRDGISIGTIAIGQTRVLTYQVLVNSAPTTAGVFENQIFLSYQFESLPGRFLTGTVASEVNRTTAINTPPTVPNYTLSTPEDTAISGTIIGKDVDANPLAYTLNRSPANGTAAVNSIGLFTYTPNANFNGTDSFTVLVNDGNGGTAISTVTVTVVPVNDLPVTQNYSFTTAEDTQISGRVIATDPDSAALTFTLQGAPINGSAVVNIDGTFIYTPRLNFTGTDSFTLLVDDGNGGTVLSTVTITVLPVNDPPVVPNYTVTTEEDTPVVGQVIATDADNDALTYFLQSVPTNGTAAVNTNGFYTYTPNTNFNGTDVFVVRVSDENGGTVFSTITVNVQAKNDAPTTQNYSLTTLEDTPTSGQVIATDIDGDLLTFTLQNASANGTVVVNTDGTYTYMPNANFNGTDSFTVLVEDNRGGTALSTVTVTVFPVNDPPVAPNYIVTTEEDSPVIGQVVVTDVDNTSFVYSLNTAPASGTAVVSVDGMYTYTPNANFNGTDSFTVLVGDRSGGTAFSTITVNVSAKNDAPLTQNYSLTTIEDTAAGGQVIATDVDGDLLTFTLQNAPVNGEAVVNADGTYTYTPNANFNGTDSFTVLVEDGQGGFAISTIQITVSPLNDPPIAPSYTVTTEEDSSVAGQVVAIDVDGSALTYSLQTEPANGIAIVNVDGTYTYTPNLNFNGTDVFTVLVSDSGGASAISTITVEIIPVNDVPLSQDYIFTTLEDTAVSGQVITTDTDGDSLSFTVNNFPTNGSVIVEAGGSFTYTPNPNFNGIDIFTIRVEDGNGGVGISTVTMTVTPVNDIPIAEDRIVYTEQNVGTIGIVNAVDPDGDSLIFTLQDIPINGTAVVNANGTFTYTPNLNFTGTDTFTILIDDSNGGTDIALISMIVIPTNGTTTATDVAITTNEDTTAVGQVVGTNSSGNPVAYSIQDTPTNGIATINAVTGQFTYTPNADFNGTDIFTVAVDDGLGGIAIPVVTVTILPVNDAPTIADYNFTTIENVSLTAVVTGTDIDLDTLVYSLQQAPSNGAASVNIDGTFTYTPNANFFGIDTFTILVDDENGGTAVSTITVTVLFVNESPTGPNTIDFTTLEDTAVTGQIVFTDSDGDILIYTLQDPPASGTVTVNSDGTFTFIPSAGFNGSTSFTIRVDDSNGGIAIPTINITVTPVNTVPTVPDYSLTTIQEVVVSGQVVGVDVDNPVLTYAAQALPINGTVVVNGDGTFTYTPNAGFVGTDSFTVLVDDTAGGTAVSTVTVAVTPVNLPPTAPNTIQFSTLGDTAFTAQIPATDPNNDPLIYTLVTAPTYGTVVVNTDGRFTYTPNLDFNGNDFFDVRVDDGNGGFVIPRVQITVIPVNDAPTVPDYSLTTIQEVAVSGQVVGTDVDSPVLTYVAQALPINGTVVVNGDGTFTYTPNAGFVGTDSFTVLVDDTAGGTAISTVTVIVTPVNLPPSTPNVIEIATQEDVEVAGQVSATDPNGDPLSYTLVTAPTYGTVVLNIDGSFVYSPNSNFNGNDFFDVRVDDGNGGFVIPRVQIIVTPVNDAPTVPNYTLITPKNSQINGQVIATDPDDSILLYIEQSPPANGTAVVNMDGTFTYTPNSEFVGTDSFTILVDDGESSTTLSTISVTVIPVNSPPITSDIAVTTNENNAVSGQLDASDPDGDVLTFTLVGTPTNGTAVVNADGTFIYTSDIDFDGTDSFSVKVSDGNGGTALATVTVTIVPTNLPPVITATDVSTLQGIPATGVIMATDPEGQSVTFTLQMSPANGTVSLNGDGTFTYTPSVGFIGTDFFIVQVRDPQGNFASGTIAIEVSGTPPTLSATGLRLRTEINTPISGQVNTTNPSGSQLQFTVGTLPSNGTVSVEASGIVIYTPATNFSGEDVFTVEVTDEVNNIAIAPIQITVIAPTNNLVAPDFELTALQNSFADGSIIPENPLNLPLSYTVQTLPQNGIVTIDNNGTFRYTPNSDFTGLDVFEILVRDSYGDTDISTIQVNVVPIPADQAPITTDSTISTRQNTSISSQVVATDPQGQIITFTLQLPPLNGTVTVNGDGTFTYTPNLDFNGQDTFTVVVSDPDGNTSIAMITIQVFPEEENLPPIVSNLILFTQQDTPISSQIIAVDPEGQSVAYVLQAAPSNGDAIVDRDGTFTYVPNARFYGADSFTVLVDDGAGGTAVSTVTITVVLVNSSPVAPNIIEVMTLEDTIVTSRIPATDPDGDALTYTQVVSPMYGTLVLNSDGAFTYTPNANFTGNDFFQVRIDDGKGGFVVSRVEVTVTPVNDAPTVPNYSFTTGQGIAVTGQITGTDIDSTELTYYEQTSPANGTVQVNLDGTFIYVPNPGFLGTDFFTVRIDDGAGGIAFSTVLVQVLPPKHSSDIKKSPKDGKRTKESLSKPSNEDLCIEREKSEGVEKGNSIQTVWPLGYGLFVYVFDNFEGTYVCISGQSAEPTVFCVIYLSHTEAVLSYQRFINGSLQTQQIRFNLRLYTIQFISSLNK